MKVFFIPNHKEVYTVRKGVFKPKEIVPFLKLQIKKQQELTALVNLLLIDKKISN